MLALERRNRILEKLQEEKRDLLESLEMYYRVFFLGEDVEDGEDA